MRFLVIPVVAVAIALSACGIKGPPRAPIDDPPSALVDAPDAGCCGAKK